MHLPDCVVKLGGSLLADLPRLQRVLTAIGESSLHVLVVPGGGPFADCVREAQPKYGFGETVAHGMAVLATEQTGLMLQGMVPGFCAVKSRDALSEAFAQGDQAIALMSGFLQDDETLPRVWQATSDTLAVWLATELTTPTLVFVKSCAVPDDASLLELSDAGILDPVCAGLVKNASIDVRVFGPADDGRLAELLAAEV
ncbi:MAG: hypothetical protein AAGG72_03045 [Pseudomonadota bacterium]